MITATDNTSQPTTLTATRDPDPLITIARLLGEAQNLIRTMQATDPNAPQRPAQPLIESWGKIIALVSKAFGVSEHLLTGPGRTQTAAHTRGVVILLARKYLGVTAAWCDQRLGRTPGSSRYIANIAQNRIDTEPPFRATVQQVEGFLVDVLGMTPTSCARKTPMRRAPFHFGRPKKPATA